MARLGSNLRGVFTLMALSLLCVPTSFAQQPKVLAPHRAIPPKAASPIARSIPSTPRSMVGGLWMTDANLKASIYMRNVVETDPMTVTPILYLSNGTRYQLADVTLDPGGIAILSINDALDKMGISSYAPLSGYVELQYTWPWDPLCATIRDVDVAHSLIFTYGLRPATPLQLSIVDWSPPAPTHTIEGMWWKQEPNVTGFVALANLSADPAQVTVQITDSSAKPIGEHQVTVSPHGMKMLDLPELEGAGISQGGIHIVSSGTTDQLIANGGLEDLNTGYSAVMPLSAMEVQKEAASDMTVASLGLMAGAADPMMLFPAGTTFTPYSVLRNIGDAPLSIAPAVWWMEAGAPRSAQLPKIDLLPFETRALDLMSLLSSVGPKNFNGSFNLVFDSNAKPGSLLLSSGSVDQTNTYVFEVLPHLIAEGGGKSLQYWSTGNGDDTMVTVWNPADEAQDFLVTLFYAGGHYALPLHLEARVTRVFNISEIVHNQIPDAEGNVVPAGVQEGGFKISGSQAENQPILVGIDAGTYNVRKAICGPTCENCNGYTAVFTIDGLFAVGVGGTHQQNAYGNWNTGGQYNLTGNSTWSSNHTNIATVSNGGGTSGRVSGVSPGSFTASWTFTNAPVGAGYICHNPNMGCPTSTFANQGNGTVQVPTSLSIVAGTDSTTTEASCTGGGCGCTRSFTYQVNDQNGAPMNVAGLDVWDSIATTSPNNLTLQSYNTTCVPANTGPCGVSTDANGQFQEAALGACAPACKSNNQCIHAGPTNADQTWHVGSATIVKHVGYYCDHVTVN